jgi:urease accessory protein
VPHLASPALYVLGFTLTTILLHVAGVGLGTLARKSTIGAISLRVSGMVVTALGMFLLAMM